VPVGQGGDIVHRLGLGKGAGITAFEQDHGDVGEQGEGLGFHGFQLERQGTAA
jgi:hypothetical protein